MKFKHITYTLFIVLLLMASNSNAAISQKDRACSVAYESCKDGKNNSTTCKQMKQLMKDLKYSCSSDKAKTTATRVFACYQNKESAVNLSQPNWLSVSWDITNPKIYGYCDSPNATTSRQCAHAQCQANGGKQCMQPCDHGSGSILRACRIGVQTYVASSDYGRFGCGTRYIKDGTYTPRSYSQREKKRCITRSKSSDCVIHKLWQ